MGTNHPWVEKSNRESTDLVTIAIPERAMLIALVRNARGITTPCLLTVFTEPEEIEYLFDETILLSWDDDESGFDDDESDDLEDDDLIDDDIFDDDDDDDDDFDDDYDGIDDDDDDDDDDDFDDDFDDIDIDRDEEDF